MTFDTVTFPGLIGIQGGRMTVSRGVRPSQCLIRCRPSPSLPYTVGTLSWLVDGSPVREFQDAAILDKPTLITHGLARDGWLWDVLINDRRWKLPTV